MCHALTRLGVALAAERPELAEAIRGGAGRRDSAQADGRPRAFSSYAWAGAAALSTLLASSTGPADWLRGAQMPLSAGVRGPGAHQIEPEPNEC
jgi:hypothetical protein